MKTIRLSPVSTKLKGQLQVPGDKSISHRSVMFGSIANGKTVVTNFLAGDDCLSTISCFRKLGVKIEQQEEELHIYGTGYEGLQEPVEILDVGNSGTTIRLMMGLLSGVDIHACFVGDESIAKRPMSRVAKPLRAMGANIDGRVNGEYIPLSVRGGNLKGITYEMPVASAQVKSAILLAGLRAVGETRVLETMTTRDHTERMISKFGGEIQTDGKTITISGGQQLHGTRVKVPGDISSAAFFLAAGAVTKGSEITLINVGLNPTRKGIINVLQDMGADLTIEENKEDSFEPVGNVTIRYSSLKGVVIEGEQIPTLIDEIPIIAFLATQAEGKTIIKDAAELKVKETNRIDTVVNELKKLGAKIEATEDGMIIEGNQTLKGGSVSSHGDHRIGMMLSIASLICKETIELENPEAISVSYPNFFDHLNSLQS